MNICVAEVFQKGGKTEKMLNFVYSQRKLLANYTVQFGVARPILCNTLATLLGTNVIMHPDMCMYVKLSSSTPLSRITCHWCTRNKTDPTLQSN